MAERKEYRKVKVFKRYYLDFYEKLPAKVREKILYVLELIRIV